MKLHDPSGSNKTIETSMTTNEIQTLVFAKYSEQAKNIAAQIRSGAKN